MGVFMRRLIFVRHALTDYNLVGSNGRFCGRVDPPLNTVGIAEAHAVRALLSSVKIETAYSSTLSRSKVTADIIVENRCPVHIDSRLEEIGYGEWEGLSKSDVRTHYPLQYEAFVSDPLHYCPPGGETAVECLRRAKEWLATVTALSVLVVGHKTWARLLICDVLDINLGHFRTFIDPKIAAVTVLVCEEGAWRLEAVNFGATLTRIFDT
jgi:broad specificity phosphatase PhoE